MSLSFAQVSCPVLQGPMDGDVNVPVDATITWNDVAAPGYRISIGTTPGGTEIVNERNLGNATSFTPPLGLPQNTVIYVRLTIFFFNSPDPDIVCDVGSFRTEVVTTAPPCSVIATPADGATDVNVASAITWDYTPTAEGYIVSIGTTPGGTELLNNFDVGNVLSYTPAADFPFNTTIYVRIVPYNIIGLSTNTCPEFSFTTGAMATLPQCTQLISPANGSINVPLTPNVEWTPVPNAIGYRVTVGLSPTTGEVLDNVVFTNTSTRIIDFDPNRTFFIRIVPFNDAGDAIGCTQETFSTILGCGPYLDAITGELVDLAPELNFPDTVSFCANETPYFVSTTDTAEGFRWFRVDSNGNETLISTDTQVDVSEPGTYRYEAYNTVSQSGNTVECPKSKEFTVVSSEVATITSLDTTIRNGDFEIVTQVTGSGDYEFALNNSEGPYQDSNVFTGLPSGSYTVYVRDKNGCGIAEESIIQDLTLEGFPRFFSPNGDGVNDYWQFIPPTDTGEINVRAIQIFDRYGNFLKQIDPLALGWDGKYNGRPMPSSDYWFTAISLTTQKKIKGHFSLKR